jgi:hypothetical protein
MDTTIMIGITTTTPAQSGLLLINTCHQLSPLLSSERFTPVRLHSTLYLTLGTIPLGTVMVTMETDVMVTGATETDAVATDAMVAERAVPKIQTILAIPGICDVK